MVENVEMDLLTLPEAARLLKVSVVTLHRWIKQHRLSAYYVGPRKIRIRRSDLSQMVTPVHREELGAIGETIPIAATLAIKPLTEQEIQQGIEAMREADELIQAMRSRRNGRPLPASWPLIRKAREERSKQLR